MHLRVVSVGIGGIVRTPTHKREGLPAQVGTDDTFWPANTLESSLGNIILSDYVRMLSAYSNTATTDDSDSSHAATMRIYHNI